VILDFTQSGDQFWHQCYAVETSLRQFAKLDLIESQKEKDKFLADCHTLVSQLQWDSIGGGCYQINENYAVFQLENNAIIASFLLSAGKTFFDGQLTYAGHNILNSINRLFIQNKQGLLTDGLSYKIAETPFIINGKQIERCLSPQQQKLLSAFEGATRYAQHNRDLSRK